MFHHTLARFLAAADSPTADLYFVNACGDFLLGGMRRLGPTVFAAGDTRLVMRHDLRAEPADGVERVGRAERAVRAPAGRRLVYFIDDAVEQGVRDACLPFLYRQKLRLVERDTARRVVPAAAAVVVSSPVLARLYSDVAETHVIHPYWSEAIAGHDHFARLLGGEGWIDVACLGSAVHRADLAFLWPVLGAVLAAHPRVRLHLPERQRVPPALAGHPRILAIPGRGWTIYRAALRPRRFHLALYPLMDTPFNRARSVNKLIEHAVVGAAPLYSRSWPEAWRAGAAGAGLLLGSDPGEWRDAIEGLLARPGEMLGLAGRAGELGRALNRPGPQRRLWAHLMEGRLDAAA
ncbi:MAG TPA: hypothetical protein VMM59_10750 [Thermohalobaculum sp.]|nr:hypothetical protein [Thermohalobaculum sp.]